MDGGIIQFVQDKRYFIFVQIELFWIQFLEAVVAMHHISWRIVICRFYAIFHILVQMWVRIFAWRREACDRSCGWWISSLAFALSRWGIWMKWCSTLSEKFWFMFIECCLWFLEQLIFVWKWWNTYKLIVDILIKLLIWASSKTFIEEAVFVSRNGICFWSSCVHFILFFNQ